MNLQKHPGVKFHLFQLLVHLDHSQLDDIGRRALDWGVDGGALGKLAPDPVGVVYVRQQASPVQ